MTNRIALEGMILLSIVAGLSACAGTDAITPVGKDTFMASSNGSKWDSIGYLRNDAVAKGTAYCAGLGKDIKVITMENSRVHGYQPQEVDITFQCLTMDDPRNHGAAVPAVVIGTQQQAD